MLYLLGTFYCKLTGYSTVVCCIGRKGGSPGGEGGEEGRSGKRRGEQEEGRSGKRRGEQEEMRGETERAGVSIVLKKSRSISETEDHLYMFQKRLNDSCKRQPLDRYIIASAPLSSFRCPSLARLQLEAVSFERQMVLMVP